MLRDTSQMQLEQFIFAGELALGVVAALLGVAVTCVIIILIICCFKLREQ